MLDAFEFGAPPHGGIARGIDRTAALLAQTDDIREVIAFPKTKSATDPMTGAPSPADPAQLDPHCASKSRLKSRRSNPEPAKRNARSVL